MVLLDENFAATHIYEANRADVIAAITRRRIKSAQSTWRTRGEQVQVDCHVAMAETDSVRQAVVVRKPLPARR
jgi:hypothetical protein